MPLILTVVLLILIGLLRAIVAPLILMATVVLSFGAALGISALLFEYVFGFAGSDPGFPLFAFVFLVALGIDYNIFLMTRVREETATYGTRKGSLIALASTGGVITSAGIVLAATFLVLGSLPLVFLAELGVAVALGVMLDTLIVRSVLVTAINLDLGGKIWWPSKLDQADAALTAAEAARPRWRRCTEPRASHHGSDEAELRALLGGLALAQLVEGEHALADQQRGEGVEGDVLGLEEPGLRLPRPPRPRPHRRGPGCRPGGRRRRRRPARSWPRSARRSSSERSPRIRSRAAARSESASPSAIGGLPETDVALRPGHEGAEGDQRHVVLGE